jgi:flagellar biosynthesis anti-sigma factor FlgM
MRIDGFQNIPAILQSFKADKSTKSNSGNDEGDSSSVSLSSFGEILQSLQRESAQADKTRNARVDQISQQVQSGNFAVDAEKLAAKLLDLSVINTKG